MDNNKSQVFFYNFLQYLQGCKICDIMAMKGDKYRDIQREPFFNDSLTCVIFASYFIIFIVLSAHDCYTSCKLSTVRTVSDSCSVEYYFLWNQLPAFHTSCYLWVFLCSHQPHTTTSFPLQINTKFSDCHSALCSIPLLHL